MSEIAVVGSLNGDLAVPIPRLSYIGETISGRDVFGLRLTDNLSGYPYGALTCRRPGAQMLLQELDDFPARLTTVDEVRSASRSVPAIPNDMCERWSGDSTFVTKGGTRG